MTWADWLDLKIMDILLYFYIIGAILAFIIIVWFISSIIDVIKHK
mgnify:FL=1